MPSFRALMEMLANVNSRIIANLMSSLRLAPALVPVRVKASRYHRSRIIQ